MKYSTEDPYVDSQTGTLRNLLGITDPAVLEQIEADLTLVKAFLLMEDPVPGDYDLAHLQAFHRELFGDIYDWAGELRTVGISRTEPFCLPQHIEASAADIFSALRAERWLRGLERPAFVERFAHYLGEVNAIHPFREGNGRAQRAFFGQLAKEANWGSPAVPVGRVHARPGSGGHRPPRRRVAMAMSASAEW
jgi:cell filamentation protein